MIGFSNNPLKCKEVCDLCSKNVLVGQPSLNCHKCDRIFHKICNRKSKYLLPFRSSFFCKDCLDCYDIIKYNPFFELITTSNSDDKPYNDTEPVEYLESIQEISDILESCKIFNRSEFSRLHAELSSEKSDLFSTYFHNIDGNQANFDAFSAHMKSLNAEFSVIGIAETNIDTMHKDLYKLGDNYSSVYLSKLENKAKGSGIGMYINSNHNYIILEEMCYSSENLQSLFVKITNRGEPTVVGVLYRPPNGNMSQFNLEIIDIISKVGDSVCYIMGDFNVDMFTLSNNLSKEFEEIIVSNGYIPTISVATHQQEGCRKTCIDNIFTNIKQPIDILCSGSIKGNISSHCGIFQISEYVPGRKNSPTVSKIKIEYEYSRERVGKFICLFRESVTNETPDSMESLMSTLSTCIDRACKLLKPKTTKRNSINNPWITQEIIESIAKNDELYENWATSRRLGQNKANNLKQISKTYQKTLRWQIKKAKSKYYLSKFNDSNGDRRKAWKLINTLRGKSKHSIKPSFIIDSERIVCRRIIASKFQETFVNLAKNLNKEAYSEIPLSEYPPFHSYLNNSPEGSLMLEDCTEDEIVSIIKELEIGKSSDIPIMLIKAVQVQLAPVLTNIYNDCMTKGVFPQILKTSRITPIFKKGDAERFENYRPVSTLPIFGKIFEKVLYRRLVSFLDSKGVLNECQFGFRKNHSTVHAIHHSVDIVKEALGRGQEVLGIFIDLSKAFDTIDHKMLLSKLEHYGIRGNANCLIRSYLTGRSQYTEVLGEKSRLDDVLFGVPQGSVLGPLLFIIYINDIINCVNGILGIKLVLYADDTNVFIIGNNRRDLIRTGAIVLDAINRYMKSNLLHINVGKCCYIHFCKGKSRLDNVDKDSQHDELRISGKIIEEVDSTKFLGVTIDKHLTWQAHCESLHKKLKSATGILKRIRPNIPKECYKTLYHTLFESHLSYCITVFGNANKNFINKLFITQKHCLRILFGDLEAYLDKFNTSCRVRSLESQILGSSFYCREHTKPLFKDNLIMTVHNLVIYHTCLETLKIVQNHSPSSLYSAITLSDRNNGNLMLYTRDISYFAEQRVGIWNRCVNSTIKHLPPAFVKLSLFKNVIKRKILEAQSAHDSIEWYPSLNFGPITIDNIPIRSSGR